MWYVTRLDLKELYIASVLKLCKTFGNGSCSVIFRVVSRRSEQSFKIPLNVTPKISCPLQYPLVILKKTQKKLYISLLRTYPPVFTSKRCTVTTGCTAAIFSFKGSVWWILTPKMLSKATWGTSSSSCSSSFGAEGRTFRMFVGVSEKLAGLRTLAELTM